MPTPRQRNSVEAVFVNGTGNAELTIDHTSATMQVIWVLLGAAAAIGIVIGLSRGFPPLLAGGLVGFVALIALAFAGPGSTPFWNGTFFAAAVLSLLMLIAARRGRKA